MFIKLTVLLATLASSHAVTPPICNSVQAVPNGISVEKSLCLVKKAATAYQAGLICKANNMTLYSTSSSAAALTTVTAVVRDTFGGSSSAQVYVAGRNINSRCLTVKGNGKVGNVWCGSSFMFVCEIETPVVNMKCTSYGTGNYQTVSPSLSTVSCSYSGIITAEKTILTTTASRSKEQITSLYMNNGLNIYFLPIDLAISFPNLKAIDCNTASIKTINAKSFAGLSQLVIISLPYSQLEELNIAAFKDLTSLKFLELNRSRLIRISNGFFSSILPVLESVRLGGCITTSFSKDRAAVLALPQSVSNTCTFF